MRKNLFTIFFIGSALLYFIILLFGPVYIRFLFDHGQVDFLNRLALTSSSQSLDFYLGRCQETILGPLAQVISGIFLIALILKPFKDISSLRFFLLIFGYLVVTKWNALTFPPYGDAIGGPFAEGMWLANNNFNYVGLFNQPGYAEGGPKAYLFSIFPTYLAVMMKLIPSVKLFLITNHLVFFAMAAGVVTCFRSIGRRIFFSDVADLLALLILVWPVFQTQSEAINMELPSLFFAVVSSYALVRKRIHLAGSMAFLSVLVKGSGIFACAAFFIYGFFSFWSEKDQKKRLVWIVWGAVLLLIAVLIVAAKFWIKDQHASAGMVRLFAGLPSLKQFPITYFFLVNLIVVACLGAWEFWKKIEVADIRRETWRVNLIQLVFAAMWFFLFLNFYAVSPRYRVAVYPFFLFTLAWTFARLVPWKIVQLVGLIMAILAVQFNSYGFKGQVVSEDMVLLEENLQYRNDLIRYQRIAKTIEEKYAGATIVAPFIVAQTLAIPQLGYVKQGRDVIIYGFNCTYGSIRPYPGIQGLDISKTIYIATTVETVGGTFPYPINPQDKILEISEWGNKKAWIFMGGFSIDLMKKIQERIPLQKAQSARQS